MPYQILFTDIDGTLLNNRGEISTANRLAAKKAIEKGKQIVLCSGRSWRSMAHYEAPLGINKPGQYGISFNGGITYAHIAPGSEQREILSKKLLPRVLGLQVATRLTELGADVLIYAGEECYAEGRTDFGRQYSEASKLPIRLVDDFAEIKTDTFVLQF
jgi:hydroxymethylpyrimidine pyrophosphatase-like HAD family hydrolase